MDLYEEVAALRASWEGPRCPHGVPIGAPGPDLICDRCEAEDEEAYSLELLHARLDRGEGYGFSIGPLPPYGWQPPGWDAADGDYIPF